MDSEVDFALTDVDARFDFVGHFGGGDIVHFLTVFFQFCDQSETVFKSVLGIEDLGDRNLEFCEPESVQMLPSVFAHQILINKLEFPVLDHFLFLNDSLATFFHIFNLHLPALLNIFSVFAHIQSLILVFGFSA